MANRSERLSVLSNAEQFALYGLPDFDDAQRSEHLSLSESEMSLVSGRPGLRAQVHCALQIGYFKAKNAFFRFTWDDVQDDTSFVQNRYFEDRSFEPRTVPKNERLAQRAAILELFAYRPWSAELLRDLVQQASQIVRRDVTAGFIVAELIAHLKEQKIVRPGYTTLQTLISEALTYERRRLGGLLGEVLDDESRNALAQLLVHDDTLSELAALKQDAKNFGWRQMAREREKRVKLEPLHRIAKTLLPRLAVSKQNLLHYASLANFYTIYDLRRLKPDQTHLYLLCYAWRRYRQMTDNLVDASAYHIKQLEDESKLRAGKLFFLEQMERRQETPQMGRLLRLYVDERVSDATPFGDVRQRAFKIMARDSLERALQRLAVKRGARLVRRHLRPLFVAIDFSSTVPDNPWIAALGWVKGVFVQQQRLSVRPIAECPEATLPKRLRPYLLTFDAKGEPTGLHADRYEFWLYRQLRKRLKSGELYLDDSLEHRCFTEELVSIKERGEELRAIDIPWLRQPAGLHLDELTRELHEQWMGFNRDLRLGKLKHLEYDGEAKTLTWHRPKVSKEGIHEDAFYEQLLCSDVADVFRFVDRQCGFLSAMTPLQPRYAKQSADSDNLTAVILAQAMNHGNLVMARTSDVPYHVLETTYRQYLRQASLQAANDRISNAIAELPIFPHYSFDLDVLYGSVDGQKFSVERPTVKARHSRKYFGRGKGIVAYTLLCNHVPLQAWLIGAHEFEAHHVFDIWYRNTSDIVPTAITGDMHSVNKANFAVLYCFGRRFEPRFTRLEDQLKDLCCGDDPALYEKCLIRPTGTIDRQAILDEKHNIDQIVATLGLKEMTQGTLVRKLCSYTQPNPTRRASSSWTG